MQKFTADAVQRSADLAEIQTALNRRDQELQQSKKTVEDISKENESLRDQLRQAKAEAKHAVSDAHEEITKLQAMLLIANIGNKDLAKENRFLCEQLQTEIEKAEAEK